MKRKLNFMRWFGWGSSPKANRNDIIYAIFSLVIIHVVILSVITFYYSKALKADLFHLQLLIVHFYIYQSWLEKLFWYWERMMSPLTFIFVSLVVVKWYLYSIGKIDKVNNFQGRLIEILQNNYPQYGSYFLLIRSGENEERWFAYEKNEPDISHALGQQVRIIGSPRTGWVQHIEIINENVDDGVNTQNNEV